jgi:hypothetical protein
MISYNEGTLFTHYFLCCATIQFYNSGSIPSRKMNCSLCHRVQRGSWPTQPPIQRVSVHSTEEKRLEREADHSPIFTTEYENVWSFTGAG